MKVGILTQPIFNNYGGILQAWALQLLLARLGHEPWLLRRNYHQPDDYNFLLRWFWFASKRLLNIIRGGKDVYILENEKLYIGTHTQKFVEERFYHLSPIIHTAKELTNYVKSGNFNGFVVGSDQVWRPKYSPQLSNYFLDFAKNSTGIKRIAYAASFGVDEWEFSEKEEAMARKLIPLFDMISVREASGVELLNKHLGVTAHHVLDPTLLVEREDYISLVKNTTSTLIKTDGDLFCYILDESTWKNELCKDCANTLSLKPFSCYSKRRILSMNDKKHLQECIMPPVEQWIKAFIDAKMVITDSFHGMVFSIIFNKPFWIIINENRGASRFDSLLSYFGLENRIISKNSDIVWNAPIDWSAVNKIRSENKIKSIELLRSNLI